MSEIEKMYKLANVAKPVIKKWHYDGYYEDFSWESSEEDCTELLKYFDNSIDKLNDRIQQMKKEKNTKYDRYTDSVDTEFGRIEKAYIDCPPFTAEKQIELIKFLLKNYEGLDISKKINRFNFLVDNATFIGCHHNDKSFEESLAGVINKLWADMPEEEKLQVKGILE